MASCHSTRREPALHERIIQQTILRQRSYGVLSLLAPWISTWPENRLPSRHSLYRWSAWAALLEAGIRIGRCQIQKRLLFRVSTLLRYVLGRLSFWRRYAARGYWGHGRSRWGCCCYSLESIVVRQRVEPISAAAALCVPSLPPPAERARAWQPFWTTTAAPRRFHGTSMR